VVSQQPTSLLGIRGVETERDGVPAERVAQIVAARRPALADHADHLVAWAVGPRPRGEGLLYLRVEQLFGGGPPLHRPEIDPPERGRSLEGLQLVEGDSGPAPVHRDQERAYGTPVQRSSPL
jgi:hypothetical protein